MAYDSRGLLTKRVSVQFSNTYEYRYKAVKVSSALASKVEAQQWALINDNLNMELGLVGMPGHN